MSSSQPSRNGKGPYAYEPAQIELRYAKESPRFVQHLISHGLTPCEREICYLALESRDIKDAQSQRGGSSKTIERHRAEAIRKLGIPPKMLFKTFVLELFMTLGD